MSLEGMFIPGKPIILHILGNTYSIDCFVSYGSPTIEWCILFFCLLVLIYCLFILNWFGKLSIVLMAFVGFAYTFKVFTYFTDHILPVLMFLFVLGTIIYSVRVCLVEEVDVGVGNV